MSSLTNAGINVDPVALAAAYGVRLPLLESRTDKAPIFGYHLQAGVLTVNEVRARLGEPALHGPDGDALVGAEPEATPPATTEEP